MQWFVMILRSSIKKHIAVLGPLVSPAVMVCEWCRLISDLFLLHLLGSHGSNWTWSLQMSPLFRLFYIFTSMTFDVGMWPLASCAYKGFHVIYINPIWLVSDFNFLNDTNSTFSADLTLDLRWPLIFCNFWPHQQIEGSHVASVTKVWLKSIKACGRYCQMSAFL